VPKQPGGAAERARDMRQPPVYVLNHSQHNFRQRTTQADLDEIEDWTDRAARRMYEGAGLGHSRKGNHEVGTAERRSTSASGGRIIGVFVRHGLLMAKPTLAEPDGQSAKDINI
jgi:hypothetical protein